MCKPHRAAMLNKIKPLHTLQHIYIYIYGIYIKYLILSNGIPPAREFSCLIYIPQNIFRIGQV